MKIKEPMVGVFMPAYNQGEYIDDAIESLKGQTFQNFVVHIVDDGSDDGKTLQKLKSIRYEKAKVYLNSDNRGVAFRAREHYKMFKTKYVMVLCADDKLAPEFLEKTVEFLENSPEYGAVSTDILEYWDDFNGEPFYKFTYDAKQMGFPEMLVRCNCLGSSLMRKKALETSDLSGGFKRYQDWDRYVSMIEAGWKLGVVNEPLFLYRQHLDSLSHTSDLKKGMDFFDKMLKKHAESYKKYYDGVERGIYYLYLEQQEGKNWLEQQYKNHLKEIERLNKEIEGLKKQDNIGKKTKIRKKIQNVFNWIFR